MSDIDKLLYILNTLKIKYSDYYRPNGRADVQICDRDTKVIGVVWFDADGNFESCDFYGD